MRIREFHRTSGSYDMKFRKTKLDRQEVLQTELYECYSLDKTGYPVELKDISGKHLLSNLCFAAFL